MLTLGHNSLAQIPLTEENRLCSYSFKLFAIEYIIISEHSGCSHYTIFSQQSEINYSEMETHTSRKFEVENDEVSV